MEVCKAIIQEGNRKGKTCEFPAKEYGYCQRHQRNRIYDEGIAEGKKWCRFFFRGCNNTTQESSCGDCRKKLTKKTLDCKHIGCKFKILEGEFCKKHERDKYRVEEKEKNIKYCDIDRGCFTVLKDTKSCDNCLEKARNTDNNRHNRNRIINTIAKSRNTNIRTCIKCSKDFEVFQTRYNKNSVNCKDCSENQKKQDKKREDRKRNYKEEHNSNIDSYYKIYINKSKIRGYGDFQIDYETFSELVTKPCYYCKYLKENETNGIDRINNDIGYIKENCVSCCWKCNRMKHFYHPVFFIEKCKILIKEKNANKEFYNEWSLYYTRSCHNNYTTYKRVSENKRDMEFEITQQQWDWLTRSPCYLCSYQDPHGIGIDRVDNTIRKYTLENCRACCGSCNTMKNELSLEDLLEQCKKISDTWPIIDINIPASKNPLKKSEVKPEDRKHWKADGIYYAILSEEAELFLEANKGIYSKEEFDELCIVIKSSTKDNAISLLKKLIIKLKQRKNRAKSNI